MDSSTHNNSQGGFPLHSLASDETWHYYAGDGPITLIEFDLVAKTIRRTQVGITLGAQPQYTVANSTWVAALLQLPVGQLNSQTDVATQTTWALTGAQNTPGFDPRDSVMAADNKTLLEQFYEAFPDDVALIKRLTSF